VRKTTAGARGAAWGFTLVELLVVMAIIGVLVTIAAPAFLRVRYNAQSASCAALHSQVIKGCINYAMDNKRCYPPRFVEADTDDEPFMWSTQDGTKEIRAVAEKYLAAPKGLMCPLSNLGFKWPDVIDGKNVYRASICVYAGWRMKTSSAVSDAQSNLDQIALEYGNHRPDLPLSGDYLADHTLEGAGKGWVTPHRPGQDPDARDDKPDMPVDPIPFGYEDNSVRMKSEFEKFYVTSTRGTKYWAMQTAR